MNGISSKVNLKGIIATPPVKEETYGDEGIYSFKVSVVNGTHEDKINVRVSDRFTEFRNLKVGCGVIIEGSLRSINKANQTGYRSLHVSVFTQSLMVLPEVGADFEYENTVELEGELTETFFYKEATSKTPQICDRMIKVHRAFDKVSLIPLVFKGRNAEFVSTLKADDEIHCKGFLRERKFKKTFKGIAHTIESTEIMVHTMNRKV